jgi:protein TonB
VLTSAFAFRVAALMASALAHVLLYGALSLAPAWSPPPRTGLLITDLLVTEPPAPALRIPQPVTPPRPLVRPTPPKRPVEIAPPQSAAKVEPPIERDVAEPPMVAAPPTVAAAETAQEVIEAGPAPPASEGMLRGPSSSVTTLSQPGAGLAVAGLPPTAPAAAPGALTRTAIPRGGYQITPSYPASARQLGVEGTALLSVFVDAAGRVGEVIVKQSAGHPDLDRAAAEAVRRWRFEPARRGAEAVAMWVELPVEFRLR